MTRSVRSLALGFLLIVAACGSGADRGLTDGSTITVGASPAAPSTARLGHVVELFWPPEPFASDGPGLPLIVLVPGGGWVTADPSGLISLAEALAERGAVTAVVTYRAAEDGVYFPEQAQEVACAIASAAAHVREAGHEPREVVVVGHSAGAHLGALVTLRPGEFAVGCADLPAEPDRFIGLAGPYDVGRAQTVAGNLFGPSSPDPADWSTGNPLDHAASRPHVDVLLMHGASDRTVPIRFTESFAEALEEGGHTVTVTYLESDDHHTVYSAETAAPIIAEWLDLQAGG
jgi:acetyl esterase/lipase